MPPMLLFFPAYSFVLSTYDRECNIFYEGNRKIDSLSMKGIER